MQDESSELYTTVREVREEKFPRIDARLVDDLLGIQVQYASDPVEGKKRTETTINAWAAEHGEEG